jgi:hypothetical protein
MPGNVPGACVWPASRNRPYDDCILYDPPFACPLDNVRLGGHHANAKPHTFIAFVREYRQRTPARERGAGWFLTGLPAPEMLTISLRGHGIPGLLPECTGHWSRREAPHGREFTDCRAHLRGWPSKPGRDDT